MPLGECNVLCKKSPLYMFNTFVRADASDAAITYVCPCCTQYFTRCIVCFVAAGRVGLPNTFLLPSLVAYIVDTAGWLAREGTGIMTMCQGRQTAPARDVKAQCILLRKLFFCNIG